MWNLPLPPLPTPPPHHTTTPAPHPPPIHPKTVSYYFIIRNPLNNTPLDAQHPIDAVAYCDDGTHYLAHISLDMILHTNHHRQLNSAALSLVMKIGRPPSKGGIEAVNLPPGESLPATPTLNWSYKHRGPHQEHSVLTIHTTTSTPVTPAHPLAQGLSHLSPLTRVPVFERILGAYCFLLDTTATHAKIYKSITTRTHLLSLAPTHTNTLAFLLNTLVTSAGSHAPLTTQLNLLTALKLDRLILSTFRTHLHITRTDAPHPIYLPTKSFGHNCRTYTEILLSTPIRELLVNLNDLTSRHGLAHRARLQSTFMLPDSPYPNYIRHALRILVRYGYLLYMPSHDLIARILAKIVESNNLHPLGHPGFPSLSNHTLGTRHTQLQSLTMHSFLAATISHHLHLPHPEPSPTNPP